MAVPLLLTMTSIVAYGIALAMVAASPWLLLLAAGGVLIGAVGYFQMRALSVLASWVILIVHLCFVVGIAWRALT